MQIKRSVTLTEWMSLSRVAFQALYLDTYLSSINLSIGNFLSEALRAVKCDEKPQFSGQDKNTMNNLHQTLKKIHLSAGRM